MVGIFYMVYLLIRFLSKVINKFMTQKFSTFVFYSHFM